MKALLTILLAVMLLGVSESPRRGGIVRTSPAAGSLDPAIVGMQRRAAFGRYGAPFMAARRGPTEYWAYQVDDKRAWLVLTMEADHVAAVQLAIRAHEKPLLSDSRGVALGEDKRRVASVLGAPMERHGPGDTNDPRTLVYSYGPGLTYFYGLDRAGHVDRYGVSNDDRTLPGLIRWYQQTGWTPDRAINPSDLGALGQTTEDRWLAKQRCAGGAALHAVSRTQVSVQGIALDKVRVRCAGSSYGEALYFALTNAVPRPPTVTPAEVALSQMRVQAEATARVQPLATSSPSPGSIWWLRADVGTPVNGERLLTSKGEGLDATYGFQLSPGVTLNSVQVVFDDSGSGNLQGMSSARSSRSAVRATSILHPAAVGGATYTCAQNFGSGSSGTGKCDSTAPPVKPGEFCHYLLGNTSAGPIVSQIACSLIFPDPSMFPHGPHGCPKTGGVGNPIDIVNGSLWYKYADAQLSGPFGLALTHRYDSDRAAVNSDVGYGWRTSFDLSLDLSALNTGQVAFTDGSCQTVYFGGAVAPSTSFDQASSDTLTSKTDGTFSVTTWDQHVYTFSSAGLLQSMADRFGNQQTLTWSAGTIQTVVDSLGRSLTFTHDGSNRITRASISPGSSTVLLAYDTGTKCYSGDLCSVTEPDGTVWRYQYYDPASMGGQHLLYQVIDPLGNVEESDAYTLVTFSDGDSHYRVTSQQMANGVNSLALSYTQNGNSCGGFCTTITDALGRVTTYGWDERLREVTSASGALVGSDRSFSYSLDMFGRQTQVQQTSIDGHEQTEQWSYGRDVVFTSPDGNTTYSTVAYPGATDIYDNISLNPGMTNQRHFMLVYYGVTDPRRDLISTATAPSVDVPGGSMSFSFMYAGSGLPTGTTWSGYSKGALQSRAWTFVYDARGRLLQSAGPRTDVAQKTSYSYFNDTDSDLPRRGQLNTVTDALGHVTAYASAAAPNNSYSIFGRPLSMTDANGVTRLAGYDRRGRMTALTISGTSAEPTNSTTSVAYDGFGNVISVVGPLGDTRIYSYDSAERYTGAQAVDAAKAVHDRSSIAYDSMGEPTALSLMACTQPATSCASWNTVKSTTLSYDSSGSPLQQTMTSPSNYPEILQTKFDGFDNLTSWTIGSTGYNAPQAFVNLTYGSPDHGYVSQATSNSWTATFGYDVLGNQTSQTVGPQSSFYKANSITETTHVDDFGQTTTRSNPATGTTTYGYDAAGNVIALALGNGVSAAVSYDVLDRPLAAAYTKPGAAQETVSWTYDSTASGNMGIGHVATMTDPSGQTTYTYERFGRVASRKQQINGALFTTAYTFDVGGNIATVTLPSGRQLTYGYDYANRPASVTSGSTTYVSAVKYEPFGPIHAITYGNGVTSTISHDSRYQPTEQKVTGPAGTISDIAYAVSSLEFVDSATDLVNPAYTRNYTYGNKSFANVTLDEAKTGSALWGDATYNNDGMENVSTSVLPQRSLQLAYNTSNQLVTVLNQTVNTSTNLTYDGAGNESSEGAASYTYSSRNLLTAGDGLSYKYDGHAQRVSASSTAGTRSYVYDGAGRLLGESALASGSLAYEYVWLGNLPIAQIDSGTTTHWTVNDPMRTTFIQTDAAGAVYWQADYEPYGFVYALRTPDAHQPFRFAGQEAQELSNTTGPNGDSKRFYNRYRWYRPKWGRYTQPDPLGSAGDLLNLYAYARANPSSFTDPWGLFGGGLSFGAQGEANTLIAGQGAFNASVGITFYYDPLTGEVSADLNGAVGGFYSPNASYDPASNNAAGAGVSGGLNLVGTNANNQEELDSVPGDRTYNSQADLGLILGLNYLNQVGRAENGEGRGVFNLSGAPAKAPGLPDVGAVVGIGTANYTGNNAGSFGLFKFKLPPFNLPGSC